MTSENNLRIHELINMEEMVTRIVDDIVREGVLKDDYDLGQGVKFENYTNILSTGVSEVQARMEDAAALADPNAISKPTDADQISVVKRSRGGSTVSFLIEYKPPYKLPKEVLRAGISPGMDVEKIINREKALTTDPEKST